MHEGAARGWLGDVGTFVTPYLREQHELRVLDLHPPRHDGVEYIEGSITDAGAIERALTGVDTFINMVMKSPQDGSTTEQNPTLIAENYAVNTVGLHLLLHTAHRLGIRSGVHTSSASVHNRDRDYFPSEEQVPLDGESVYGLTKGFAEQVCAYFSRWFDMNLIALRLSGPSTRQQYIEYRRDPLILRRTGHTFLTSRMKKISRGRIWPRYASRRKDAGASRPFTSLATTRARSGISQRRSGCSAGDRSRSATLSSPSHVPATLIQHPARSRIAGTSSRQSQPTCSGVNGGRNWKIR